jgi:hypothetical protein
VMTRPSSPPNCTVTSPLLDAKRLVRLGVEVMKRIDAVCATQPASGCGRTVPQMPTPDPHRQSLPPGIYQHGQRGLFGIPPLGGSKCAIARAGITVSR